MSGQFIAIEGIDTSVLNGQAEKLAQYLRDNKEINVVVTREPSDGPIGAQLRLLQNERLEMHELAKAALALADRLDQLNRDGGILSDLQDGKYIISAGYLLSAFAYQSEIAPLEWLMDINNAYFCRWPDITVFIDTPMDSYLARRVKESGFESEEVDHDRTFFEQRRKSFLEVIKTLKKQGMEIATIENDNPTTIHNKFKKIIDQQLEESNQ